MIQRTKQLISHDLIQDEEYRHFCRESYFQRGDNYKILRMIGAARNEFMLIQAAKVNTDCNFQLIAESTSNDELIVHNIFPTDHLNQNVILLTACSKLLRQEKFFRVWYHPDGVLRKRPRDQTEGLKYVEIIPEPKCRYTTEKTAVNRSAAFVHFTMLRMRLPVTNNTEQIWKNIGAAPDLQQPTFRSYSSLTQYQKSVFVPDSFIAKNSPIVAAYYIPLLVIISSLLQIHLYFNVMFL